MVIKMKQVPAGKFKAQCLAIMDQVQRNGQPLLVTKRGKPVVKVVPADEGDQDIFGYLPGPR
jgi:prevent-host-death family protein